VYFRGLARVDKVLESSNFGNMPPRYVPFLDKKPYMKNWILLIPLILLETWSILYAQSTIKGEVKDSLANSIPYLQVLLKQDGKVINGAYTNDLGFYQIFGIKSGTYDITVGETITCSDIYTLKGIYVSSAEVKFVNILFNCTSNMDNYEEVFVPALLQPMEIIDLKTYRTNLFTDKYQAVGVSFFLGYGALNSKISQTFANPFFVGITLEYQIERVLIQVEDFIGFGKVKMSSDLPDNWERRNKTALHVLGGINLGYTMFNMRTIKFVSLIGIGANLISPRIVDLRTNSTIEPFLPHLKLGCFIDFKIDYDYNTYSAIRVGLGINYQIENSKYESLFKGNMFYFTVGYGGFAQIIKRKTK
jgi:hypothetical protein